MSFHGGWNHFPAACKRLLQGNVPALRRQSFRRGASEANAACLQIKVPRRALVLEHPYSAKLAHAMCSTGDAAAHPLDVLVFEFQRIPRTFLDM